MVASHHRSEAVVIVGEKSMSIRLKGLWEDMVLKESGLINENCNFTLGLIRGFLEAILKSKIDVKEVTSERRGGVHTEFIVRVL